MTAEEGFWARMLVVLGVLVGGGIGAALGFWAALGLALGLLFAAAVRRVFDAGK